MDTFPKLFLLVCNLLLILPVRPDDAALNFEEHFSTMTPYKFVANFDTKLDAANPACKPTKIWMLTRHGTSFPEQHEHDDMLDILSKFHPQSSDKRDKKRLPNDVLKAINDWRMDATEPVDQLTNVGKTEMEELGKRIRARFPQLIAAYDAHAYRFEFTKKEKTRTSMLSFAQGLFGQLPAELAGATASGDADFMLDFSSHCPAWLDDVYHKDAVTPKIDDLYAITSMLLLMGAKTGVDVQLTQAQLAYTRCAYETAWSLKSASPWCKLFVLDEITQLEDIVDEYNYHNHGYEHAVNADSACLLLQDLYEFISDKEAPTKVAVHFSDTASLLKLTTALHLFEDATGPLLPNNQFNMERKWRTSKIAAFGSSLMFVHSTCSESGKPDYDKVELYHQERRVDIPKCENGCTMAEFKKTFDDRAKKCDFNKVCKVKGGTNGGDAVAKPDVPHGGVAVPGSSNNNNSTQNQNSGAANGNVLHPLMLLFTAAILVTLKLF